MTHALELSFAALLVRIGLEFVTNVALIGATTNVGTLTFGATALPSPGTSPTASGHVR